MLESDLSPATRIQGRSKDVGRFVCYVGNQDDLIGGWGVVTNLGTPRGVVHVELRGVPENSVFDVGNVLERYAHEWSPSDLALA